MNRQEKIDMKKLLKILLIILLLLILGVTLVWQGEIRTLATVKQVGPRSSRWVAIPTSTP